MRVTEPLRAEHAQLLPRLKSLPEAALAVEGSDDEAPAAVDTALSFLRDFLIPHAEAEDAALYPIVEQVMNAPGATATMSRDHLEVVRLTADLQRVRDSLPGAPDPDLRHGLQRILMGCMPSSGCTSPRRRRCTCPCLTPGWRRRRPRRCSVLCTSPPGQAAWPTDRRTPLAARAAHFVPGGRCGPP